MRAVLAGLRRDLGADLSPVQLVHEGGAGMTDEERRERQRERSRAWRKANPEKVREQQRAYREATARRYGSASGSAAVPGVKRTLRRYGSKSGSASVLGVKRTVRRYESTSAPTARQTARSYRR